MQDTASTGPAPGLRQQRGDLGQVADPPQTLPTDGGASAERMPGLPPALPLHRYDCRAAGPPLGIPAAPTPLAARQQRGPRLPASEMRPCPPPPRVSPATRSGGRSLRQAPRVPGTPSWGPARKAGAGGGGAPSPGRRGVSDRCGAAGGRALGGRVPGARGRRRPRALLRPRSRSGPHAPPLRRRPGARPPRPVGTEPAGLGGEPAAAPGKPGRDASGRPRVPALPARTGTPGGVGGGGGGGGDASGPARAAVTPSSPRAPASQPPSHHSP